MSYRLVTDIENTTWIINDDTDEIVDFEDLKLTMADVNNAIETSDGCCMDDTDDINKFMQNVLDTISERLDKEKEDKGR
jgi:hypothetical protein